MSIGVIVDSAGEISAEFAQKHKIIIVPMMVIFDGIEHLDTPDFDRSLFYQRYRTESDFTPTTSQPSPAMFFEAFERFMKEGVNEIIVITIASNLSGTFNSAQLARDEFMALEEDVKIHVFDTYNVAYGEGYYVEEAVRLINEGKSSDEIIKHLKTLREQWKIHAYTFVPTLEYLHRGGRIGHAKYFFGRLFKFKIVLEVNKEGVLAPFLKARDEDDALQKLVAQATNHGKKKVKGITIHHADALERANHVYDVTKQYYPDLEPTISMLGLTISSHTGPGTIGYIVFEE